MEYGEVKKIVLVTGMAILFAAVLAQASPDQIKVGVVPQFEARELFSIWKPILDALGRETGLRFVLNGAPDIAAFEKAFMEGGYDMAYMNPYHYIIAGQFQGYIPLVRDVDRTLYGVLVVCRDKGINRVDELRGKTIAFPSPNALGAALQMRQELRDFFNLDFIAKYVKTHDSVYLNVLLGEADAGGGVQKTLNRQPDQYRNKLKVIHTTKPVAPHPVVVHPRVPPEIRDRILKAWLKMGETPRGRYMLSRVPIRKLGIAEPSDYAPLKAMRLERFYVAPK